MGTDLSSVRGQGQARRALEIAAAGGHNLLLFGPPGSGKTLLASCLPALLGPLDVQQAMTLACVESLSHSGFDPQDFRRRPFRQPHHSASAVALTGGGRPPSPGEMSLAHEGVLCLDEMAEFPRHVLDMLREPLESGAVRVARAGYQVNFPARFQLIGTLNPCPCGYLGDLQQECRCSREQVQRYRSRLSGPLLERIDLQLRVDRPSPEAMLAAPAAESSAAVAARVQSVQQVMLSRQGCLNARLPVPALEEQVRLGSAERQLLEQAMQKLSLSARGLHRSLRLARTIADLDAAAEVRIAHLSEALSYRQFERV